MGCKTCGQKNWGLAHKQYQKVFDRSAVIYIFQCKNCGHYSVSVEETTPYVRRGDRMPRHEKKEEKLTQEEIEVRKKQKPSTVIVKRGGKKEEIQV